MSCDNQSVYAVMKNGIVLILAASDLTPRFEIDPSVYLPATIRYLLTYYLRLNLLTIAAADASELHYSLNVRPLAVVSHPKEPEQIALGLTNGELVILEPENPKGTWVVQQPPVSNGILANNRPDNSF